MTPSRQRRRINAGDTLNRIEPEPGLWSGSALAIVVHLLPVTARADLHSVEVGPGMLLPVTVRALTPKRGQPRRWETQPFPNMCGLDARLAIRPCGAGFRDEARSMIYQATSRTVSGQTCDKAVDAPAAPPRLHQDMSVVAAARLQFLSGRGATPPGAPSQAAQTRSSRRR